MAIFEAGKEIKHSIKEAWDAGFDFIYKIIKDDYVGQETKDYIVESAYDARQKYFNKYLEEIEDKDWKQLYEQEVDNHQQSIILADTHIKELNIEYTCRAEAYNALLCRYEMAKELLSANTEIDVEDKEDYTNGEYLDKYIDARIKVDLDMPDIIF